MVQRLYWEITQGRRSQGRMPGPRQPRSLLLRDAYTTFGIEASHRKDGSGMRNRLMENTLQWGAEEAQLSACANPLSATYGRAR